MYERKPYLSPDSKTEQAGTTGKPIRIPVFDTPISSRENFKRCVEHNNPLWVPNGVNDFNYCMGHELTGLSDLRFDFKERCDWVDLFGCTWEYVPSAGGSMLKPGVKPVVDDITKWETQIVWPSLDEERIKACCENYKSRPYYRPDRMNYYDFGQGCTERLVAILGGYEQAMTALALEPDACREFMEELSRFHCRMFDIVNKYYPTDMIMYHDDWGTERDTFFSERMMEEIVYPPTEMFINHVKEAGCYVVFHSCGSIGRFMPYFVSLGADFLQIQSRCNDVIEYKKKYGDKIGFDKCLIPMTKDNLLETIHSNVDNFAENGGMFATVFGGNEELIWDGLQELYCYSREYYEKNK